MVSDGLDITNESYPLVVLDVADGGMLRKREGIVQGIYRSNRALTPVEFAQAAIKTEATFCTVAESAVGAGNG